MTATLTPRAFLAAYVRLGLFATAQPERLTRASRGEFFQVGDDLFVGPAYTRAEQNVAVYIGAVLLVNPALVAHVRAKMTRTFDAQVLGVPLALVGTEFETATEHGAQPGAVTVS